MINLYCKSKLHLVGNATFQEEPHIANSINNHKWTNLMHRIWLKDDDLNISSLLVFKTQFENLIVVKYSFIYIVVHIS